MKGKSKILTISSLVVFALAASLVLSSVPSEATSNTVTIRPDGAGYRKGWANVGCSSGSSEWQCVDEDPADTSDYLKTSGTRKETFTFDDTGLADETINSVTIYYYAKEHNKQANSCFEAMTRSGSTDYLAGTQMCVGSSWEYVSHTYTTNPATGSAWTVAQVDALEAGMHGLNPDGGGRVAQVYAVVEYEEAGITDSCSDTDGGLNTWTFGTTSGSFNETNYSNDDYCVDSSDVMEYYCNGDYEQSTQASCGTDYYNDSYCIGDSVYKDLTDYFCSSGECDMSVTPVLQENCTIPTL